MTSAGNPNANIIPETTLYDAVNHQVVAWEADESTVTTDTSVTPNITYAKAKISGTFSSSPPSDLTASGTISAAQPTINTPVASATVVLALGSGQSTWKAMLKDGGGGFTGATTLVADKSPDGGTTWFSSSFKVNGASPNTPASTVVGPGPLELTGNAAGATHVRIRCSVLNSTETISVRIDASTGVSEVGIIAPLPVGSNIIGTVNTLHGSGIDATNSSTTPLAANAVFTGSSQSSLNYSALSIEVFADQASAANGLSIQQSTDGTNWDIKDTFNVVASTAFNTTINLIGSKYRIVYTNGATLQTIFRLQTITQTQDVVLPRTLTALGNLKAAIQEALPVGSNVIGGITAAASAFADGAITTLGLEADSAYTDGTGAASGTSNGLFKGMFVKLAAIATSLAGVLFVKRSAVAVYSLASTQSTGVTQNSGDLTVGAYTEISLDITTTAQSGTSPTLQLFYERKGADGIYYVLWQSAVLTVAANTLSTSIGAGMAYNQSLGSTGRLRWVVGGSATPTYTFSANITGK